MKKNKHPQNKNKKKQKKVYLLLNQLIKIFKLYRHYNLQISKKINNYNYK